MDKGLQEPMSQLVYGKFDAPVAESKYIVSSQKQSAQLAEFPLLLREPADSPGPRTEGRRRGALREGIQLQAAARQRAIHLTEADIVKGRSVTLRRRPDYWAEKDRRNVGTGNFDEIREIVVRDDNLAFEMFKKGDLDYFHMQIPRQWVQDLNFDTRRAWPDSKGKDLQRTHP